MTDWSLHVSMNVTVYSQFFEMYQGIQQVSTTVHCFEKSLRLYKTIYEYNAI
jgi:ASC-1-like (ASCH) protein